MKIKKAIIIHGPDRSGTTVLYNILALPKDLGWISGYTNKYPKKLWLSSLNRLQNNTWIENLNRGKRKYPRPTEAYNFWLHYVPQFNTKEAKAIPDHTAVRTQKAILRINSFSGKKRFLTKLIGNSRHQTIEAVFEDPYIIWLDRDPKAVIMSYYKQRWRYKKDPKKFESIPKKELLDQYFHLYRNFQEEKKNLNKFNLKTFYYEDLVKNKQQFFQDICGFASLEYNSKFTKTVESWDIMADTNKSYKKYLSPEEEAYLDSLLASH